MTMKCTNCADIRFLIFVPFVKEWTYGTEIPYYRFKYTLQQEGDGKVLLAGNLTQSGVRGTEVYLGRYFKVKNL